MFQKFDLFDYPLNRGRVLIEAAAGSGKTYTIQFIFLRLLLERDDLAAANVLVVTFTEAATEELKERLRLILEQAEQRLRSPELGDDDLGRVLRRALVLHDEDQGLLRRRLLQARAAFDEVVITTIHGFCNRILSDYAFECGRREGLELLRENRTLIERVSADYWRRRFYDDQLRHVGHNLAAAGIDYSLLLALASLLDQDPGLVILPESDGENADLGRFEGILAGLTSAFSAQGRKVLSALDENQEAIRELLFADDRLKRNLWPESKFLPHVDRLRSRLGASQWLTADEVSQTLDRFTPDGLRRRLKKNRPLPEHQFFNDCAVLAEIHDRYFAVLARLALAVKHDFVAYITGPDGFAACKRDLGRHGYSDFLTALNRVLRQRGGRRLGRLARERFKVALVDEFQDTDPIQNSIFNVLFASDGTLFYRIGDPKQSIYGFRGADIFAYLEEAESCDRQVKATLSHNYRANADLVTALNHLFAHPAPFLLPGIEYRPVLAGNLAAPYLRCAGQNQPAFNFWYLPAEDEAGFKVGEASERVVTAVIDECCRLLSAGEDGQPRGRLSNPVSGRETALEASDIAILTRTNAEARQLRRAALARGLPAQMVEAGNLWDCDEARELYLLLQAVVNPASDRRLLTALATGLLGLSPARLAAFNCARQMESSSAGPALDEYEAWRSAFLQAREDWRRFGVFAMLTRFPDFSAAECRSQAPDLRVNLAAVGGERALTNYYHLIEVLQAAERERRLSAKDLLLWFGQQLAGDTRDQNEYELRLESEAQALRIMTIHKSKGLEFPVVFLPFLWGDGKRKNSGGLGPIFHQAVAHGYRRCLDLGDDAGESETHAVHEALAEDLRLLYVALTRASAALYLLWPQYHASLSSALMYLRRDCAGDQLDEFLAGGKKTDFCERLDGPGALIWEEIPEIVRSEPAGFSEGSFSFADGVSPLSARKYRRGSPRHRGLVSFSRMQPDLQEAELVVPDAPAGSDIGPVTVTADPLEAFPRGVRLGNLVHEMLERLDFADFLDRDQDDRVFARLEKCCRRHGFWSPEDGLNQQRLDQLSALGRRIVSTPLPAAGASFRLVDSGLDCLSELEFYLPLDAFPSPKVLRSCLDPSLLPVFAGLPENLRKPLTLADDLPSYGYLNGYIDLVFRFDDRFYLLDWKTNFLGLATSAYHPEQLAGSVLEHGYHLQYHLYLLALHRFLGRRLSGYDYEKDFGGVYYLYVRGMNGRDDSTGVFFDRPPLALVRELDAIFGVAADCR